MQKLIDDARYFHDAYSASLDADPEYERDVRAAPAKWAPVIVDHLIEELGRLQPELDKVEKQRQHGFSNAFRRIETWLACSWYASNLLEIERLVDEVPAERLPHAACEVHLAYRRAAPVIGLAFVETLIEWSDSRSAQRIGPEVLSAGLAGYMARHISLNRAKTLRALLSMDGGPPFEKLLHQLIVEGLQLWDETVPEERQIDSLARKAASRVQQHLKYEAPRGAVPIPKLKTLAPTGDPDEEEAFVARETARTEMARYRAAKERAAAKKRGGLSSQEQQVLDLHEAGHSYKEIADRLQKTIGQVGSVLHRARKKVRREMDVAD